MIVLTVMYPNTPGARFDGDYYRDKHMPMVKELVGPACKGIGYSAGIAGGTPDSPATYIATGSVYFDSLEAFQASFPPHAPQIMADIPNYTDIEPVIEIDEVELFDVAEATLARA
jgi:uncharacterized protein (TIGR02118 family)